MLADKGQEDAGERGGDELVEARKSPTTGEIEELPDGTTRWRACVIGMANVERKLQELAMDSNSRFFALNLQERSLSHVG